MQVSPGTGVGAGLADGLDEDDGQPAPVQGVAIGLAVAQRAAEVHPPAQLLGATGVCGPAEH